MYRYVLVHTSTYQFADPVQVYRIPDVHEQLIKLDTLSKPLLLNDWCFKPYHEDYGVNHWKGRAHCCAHHLLVYGPIQLLALNVVICQYELFVNMDKLSHCQWHGSHFSRCSVVLSLPGSWSDWVTSTALSSWSWNLIFITWQKNACRTDALGQSWEKI